MDLRFRTGHRLRFLTEPEVPQDEHHDYGAEDVEDAHARPPFAYYHPSRHGPAHPLDLGPIRIPLVTLLAWCQTLAGTLGERDLPRDPEAQGELGWFRDCSLKPPGVFDVSENGSAEEGRGGEAPEVSLNRTVRATGTGPQTVPGSRA
jgi:hypothetical protein